MNKLQGSFFFSAFLFRGIRDDIEEEDEQVSEPCTVHSFILSLDREFSICIISMLLLQVALSSVSLYDK